MRYHFQEGTLSLPEQWQDKTIHVLTAGDDDARGLSFTLSRDVLPWGMTFDEFTRREVASLSRQLTGYRQVVTEDGQLLGKTALISEFRWDSPQGAIHQMMMFVHTEPRILIFTASMVGEFSAGQKASINALLASLTLRESGDVV
jgi:hypothetical protein